MSEAQAPEPKRSKTPFIIAAVVLLLVVLAGLYFFLKKPHGESDADTDATAAAAARAVHDSVLVLDSHADVLQPDTPKRYYAPDGGSRVSLEQLTQGGVDAVVLAIAVGPGPETPEGDAEAKKQAEDKLAAVKQFIGASGGRVEQAFSADDIERIHKSGKIALLLSFQNARILGKQLGDFDRFYAAGVRVAALNHAGHNAFSDSSRPSDPAQVERHHGLSDLGRQAVQRFNDLGVLIDVSQLSSAALAQTLKLSRVPVVATHSDARALVDNGRNLSDAELDAIKAQGGVVELTPFSSYLHTLTDAERQKIAQIRADAGLTRDFKTISEGIQSVPADKRDAVYAALTQAQSRATLAEFVDHIDHVAKRIGADHVGIGSDFNHGAGVVGFDGEKDAPHVTAELLKRGYTAEQIAGIWGGNFLRVLRAAEAGKKP